jgi:hypothetical protein
MVSHVEVADAGIDAKASATGRLALARLGRPTELGMIGRPAELGMIGRPTELGMIGRPAEWRAWETVSSGFPALDGLLPAGGVRRGSLIDWWAAGGADGAATVACAVACRLAQPRPGGRSSGGSLSGATTSASTIVVVDRGGRFYPPAVLPWLVSRSVASSGVAGARVAGARVAGARVAGARVAGARVSGAGVAGCGGQGIAPEVVPEMVVVRPSRDDDELWAIDQALRCPGVAAVLAWPGRMQANAMRRLQLAARASGAVGLLVRGLGDARPRVEARRQATHASIYEPTWADARVAVSPLPPVGGQSLPCPAERRLRLSLVGGPWQGEAMLEDRSVDICLDLTSGREAVSRRHLPESMAPPRAEREVRACRAS